MRLTVHEINAFSDQPFSGNPAAVCLLDEWLPDNLMQAIAEQNNLSETAFLVQREASEQVGSYHLRWFTPAVEVDLCGHATLASAFVLFEQHPDINHLTFSSRSGMLTADLREGRIVLDFPVVPAQPVDEIQRVSNATGVQPLATYMAEDLIAIYDSQQQVTSIRPDFSQVAKLAGRGLVVTAPADKNAVVPISGESVDFVSRWFGPKVGVYEDPVTGSAHCALTPYWSDALGKRRLVARQLSARGGTVYCRQDGSRIQLSGYAVRYLLGQIDVKA